MTNISLNVYQRPAQGTSFIKHFGRIYDYRHRILAVGGCDTASFTLAVIPSEAEHIFEDWIGNAVNFFGKNPVLPVWQGMISRITYEYGNIKFSRSLEEMANNAISVYHSRAAGTINTTTATSLPASIATYGQKQITIDALGQQSSSLLQRVTNLAAARLAVRSYPQSSSVFSTQSGEARLLIECIGYYRTLDWELYYNTTTGTVTLSTILADVITGLTNGTIFFDNSDTSGISISTYNHQRYDTMGKTAWQYLMSFTEAGDGVTPWVMGLNVAINPSARKFYLRAQNRVQAYTATVKRSPGIIRNLYGGVVAPYEVQPDCILKYIDVLPGWNGAGEDPRQVYVEAVDFDANRMQATIQGNDDLTYAGAMKLRRLQREAGIAGGMNNQSRQFAF